MKAKINYLRKWNAEGCCFTQTVTITLTAAQIADIRQLTAATINYGANFMKLTPGRIMAAYIGLTTDHRYKTDRNTVYNIVAA